MKKKLLAVIPAGVLKETEMEQILTQLRFADGILCEQCYLSDEQHEAEISLVRQLCAGTGHPVYIQGGIKRLEDVKKYLYAGAAAVLVKKEKDRDGSLIAETAAARFGKQRITLPEGFAYENLIYLADFTKERQNRLDAGQDLYMPVCAIPWSELKKDAAGLVPVIVQEQDTKEVLMMAYMNEEAYEQTVRTGLMNYYSRSRQDQWLKGETSGHYQYVRSLKADCDSDTLLAEVKQIGAACHTGSHSCFFRPILETEQTERKDSNEVLEELYHTVTDRKLHPKEGSYTNYLFDKGLDKILKKVGEEAAEILIAAKNPGSEEVIYEMADFLYHATVLIAEKGIDWQEVMAELQNRH
ncbi:MAG: bifunctional phosphoribosyl-AMP cyclohydrolase/phosphoribosyl-ATP diphosphatase HisIE [Lachnospiraceae bacterium]|nr:bifunctional phosphoribosyl-AMP cyclohydrolase/phosphoribosyl-ATP diphosphatase HisIE [Lachnospiraceae bacterium]